MVKLERKLFCLLYWQLLKEKLYEKSRTTEIFYSGKT